MTDFATRFGLWLEGSHLLVVDDILRAHIRTRGVTEIIAIANYMATLSAGPASLARFFRMAQVVADVLVSAGVFIC